MTPLSSHGGTSIYYPSLVLHAYLTGHTPHSIIMVTNRRQADLKQVYSCKRAVSWIIDNRFNYYDSVFYDSVIYDLTYRPLTTVNLFQVCLSVWIVLRAGIYKYHIDGNVLLLTTCFVCWWSVVFSAGSAGLAGGSGTGGQWRCWCAGALPWWAQFP